MGGGALGLGENRAAREYITRRRREGTRCRSRWWKGELEVEVSSGVRGESTLLVFGMLVLIDLLESGTYPFLIPSKKDRL